MGVTLGQQYNVGEKPTVILYTYINRLAFETEAKDTMNLDTVQFCYDGSRIGYYTFRLTRQETRFCFLIIIR